MNRRRGGRRKNREAYMERSNYYLIFCFHAVGSDKAKYYFIPPPPFEIYYNIHE